MLEPRQIRFCEEYLTDFNATRAAKAAGYTADNLAHIGWENLQKEHIKAYIEERQRQIAEKLQITSERVVIELAKIGFFDIRKIYDEDNNLKKVSEFGDNEAAAVAGIETISEDLFAGEETIGTRKTHKVKVSDKRASLDTLSKILGFYAPESINVNVKQKPNWLTDTVTETNERPNE